VEKTTRRSFVVRAGGGALSLGLGASFVAACGSGGDSGGSGGGEGPLLIGLPIPLTGVFADYGEVMEQAANVALDKINGDGGLLGRQLELLVEDTKSDPAASTGRMRRMLARNPDLIVGTVNSAVTLAVLPLIDRANVTFIYSVDGEDRTCTPDGETNPRVFGFGDTPIQRLGKFVPFLAGDRGKRWYLMGNDFVFPRSVLEVAKRMLEEAGGEVVGEEYPQLGTSDYAPVVSKIRGAKPDVVFAVVPGTDGIAFMKQASETGLTEDTTVSGVATFAAENISGIGPYCDGVVTVDRYAEAVDTPANKEFIEAYKAKYSPQYPIGGAAATTYTALMAYKAAVEKAGSLEQDDVRKALAELEMDSPLGPIRVDPENHLLNQHEYVLEIQGGEYKILEDLGEVAHPGHEGCSVQ
jgi:urea transport system substrate-binding protein